MVIEDGLDELKHVVDDSTQAVYFTHMFITDFAGTGSRRHTCLMRGYWCWKNLAEHPADVFKYIRRKVRWL